MTRRLGVMPDGLPAVEQRIELAAAGYIAAIGQVLAANRDTADDPAEGVS